MEDSAQSIYREDGSRYIPIHFSVRDRDLQSTLEEARTKIAQQVQLPYDVHLDWAGEIDELEEALGRLKLLVPIALLLVTLLVYAAVSTKRDTLVVFSAVPIAAAGGVFALLITGVHFSVSAAMGFVSLLGIAIQDALLIVSYFQQAKRLGATSKAAVEEAAEHRFRPGLMTTMVATLGLLPAALSHGIGSETQKPLAIVVIGGALFLAVLSRLFLPPLLLMVHRDTPNPEPSLPPFGDEGHDPTLPHDPSVPEFGDGEAPFEA
jgi:cobalt-zinc-cadmium resistance protein CzcA